MIARLSAALSDRYRLERELGAGGMATVYLADDLKHDRKVAIKVLHPDLGAALGSERFLTEIRTTARLQHPHILPLLDSGEADGLLYYVMPLVTGETLRARLERERQLPINDAVLIAREVADALGYAHGLGVIHRDIKPENILLQGGHALVADFGIALAVQSAGGARMTQTGLSLGTPQYMSPEQAMGERAIDARSDIYALGAVAYEMLVGEPPFTGPSVQAIVARLITEEPRAIAAQRKAVPESVEATVMRALEKLPADRFASASEFAAALSEGTARRTLSHSTARRGANTGERQRAWTVVALTLVAFAAAGGWLLGRRGGATAVGPTSYDAALPDSALVSFAASTLTVSYGTARRSLSVAKSGDFVVYAARRGESTALWYRSLRNAEVHPILGTAGATAPRVSPDGTQVAFIVGDQIMIIPVAGGEPRRLLDGESTSWLVWTDAGQLLGADLDGNRLSYLDATGGAPRSKPITRCGLGGTWVASLTELLCSANRNALFVDPESGKQYTLRMAGTGGGLGKAVTGSSFRLVDDRYLVYLAIDGSVVAARFDPASHTAGKAVTLLTGMRREAVGDGQYDLTADGSLVYAPGVDATLGRIMKLRPGKEAEPLPIESADFQRYDLSRDGRWLAAAVQGSVENELRLYDLRGDQHFTWLHNEYVRHPLWDPAGEKLLVVTRELDRWAMLRGAPNSGTPLDTLVSTTGDVNFPDAIDYHDDHLGIAQNWGGSLVFRFDPSLAKPSFDTVLDGARFASLSDKASLILYQTPDANRIMITSFPTPTRRWQLASNGNEPLWLSANEVVFRVGVSWFLVRINPASGEPLGPPTPFGRDPRFSDTPGWSNRPSHDGGIIYLQGPAQVTGNHFRVIPNWVAQMKRAVDEASK